MTSAIQTAIVNAAQSAGVDPGIALAVAQVESGGNQNARGAAGEVGIFQVLPTTAPGANLADTNTNIQVGVGYLAQLYSMFGTWPDALAAYNWGPGNVQQSNAYGQGNYPDSVQEYVNNVLGAAQSYDASLGTTSPGVALASLGIPTSWLDDIWPTSPLGYAAWAVGGIGVLLWLLD
jgi:soluble lytic murein transglycosylase-like protein